MKKNRLLIVTGCLLTGAMMGIAGCRGSTSNTPIDSTGTQYDPGSSGSVTLQLVEDHIQTGTMIGFHVYVKDSDGNPVVEMPVTCDTESGLALVEPTTGKENTDSGGQVSGKVGCNNPGSYLLACRSQGVPKRASATVFCEGNRPTGFTGFPNAGGGGLGGGSAVDDPTTDVRVTSVQAYDLGDSATPTTSIDIVQDACVASGTPTPEQFFDTHVTFSVTNDTKFLVQFTEMQYTIQNASASGTSSVTSRPIALTNSADASVDGNGGTATFNALFLDANSGGKRIYGQSANLPYAHAGFKNVTFTLTGENELGETITAEASAAFSFDDFNNCD